MMARRNVNNLTCKTVEFTDSLFKQVPSLLNGIIYEGEYGNAVLNLHKVIFSWMMGSYFNVILWYFREKTPLPRLLPKTDISCYYCQKLQFLQSFK